jgi:threonine/homoserine/homoserine lactone efflux protein
VKNARESNIALWYKVLSITTAAYFHFKAGEAFREAQELLAKEESEKKERAAKKK